MEIKKISARKYQLNFIITEDDSFNLEDDGIFFTADWYDIKILNDVVSVEYENDFLGTCNELRTRKEAQNESV
jgi:hypothetical protein